MSYCRKTIVEFNSGIDADECSANFCKNAASEFPKEEILLAFQTGPTSA